MADAKRSLSFFLEYESRGRWIPAPHLDLLCAKLEAVERGEIRRLAVFMPPRHGKSEVVSKKYPAWYIGRNPDKEMIVASYAAELAYDFSRLARNTLREWGPPLWGVTLSTDSGAVGRWGVAGHRGGLVAAGVGGPVTGRGAHVAVIDDPFKNFDEASSEVIRARVWEWYRTTLYTRLAPGGAIVLVMTRWHEDDLAGRLLLEMEAGGERWEVVNLPAVAEEGDAIGRPLGAPLWPARGFDAAWAEQTMRAVGSRNWASLYQQRPSPAEGGIFKRAWWRFYKQAPSRFDQILTSWDMAFKDEESASTDPDFVVGGVWGRVGADCYLLDQVRGRLSFVETVQTVRTLAYKHPAAFPHLVEDKANGPAVISALRHELGALIAVNPEGGKVSRANAVSPWAEAGNVYLPDPSTAPWVHDFIEECAAFPAGANDDQVDQMTQALIRLVGRAGAGGAFLPGGLPGEGGRRRRDDDEDDDDDGRRHPGFYNM